MTRAATVGQPLTPDAAASAAHVRPAESVLPPAPITYDVPTARWQLVARYTLTDDVLGALAVPAGFTFDLASVPRALWGVIAPFELSIVAPLFHDAGYHGALEVDTTRLIGPLTRGEVDALFRRLMAREGVAATEPDPKDEYDLSGATAPYTQFYGSASIFCLTPTDESTARKIARQIERGRQPVARALPSGSSGDVIDGEWSEADDDEDDKYPF